ncbi:lipase member K-like isoform X2 [Thrips palmi]|uniref:Lipase member K-like isoform X2 n=1 Tax=Thrips palmi TaxID=161013 RepID=A0A6P8ZTM0_THRPL|nr:lipase member K-like isoform X2 [Thrips palmi]
MLRTESWAWMPLALLFLVGGPSTSNGQQESVTDILNPIVEAVANPILEPVAALAPIPGALIGAASPFTSILNPLLQSALLQNNVTQFSSDIVTNLSALVALLANAALPVPPYLRPDLEAEKLGFAGENYNVTTSDGYVLGVFRVRSRTCASYRAVVVLPPGILSNAATFIYIKENSLVYRLARRCFDVWLITFRGYLFGRENLLLSDTSSEFWDFYAYHWGSIDLPAQLKFVSEKTNSTRLRYMGMDQAGTALLFMNHVHGQRYQRLLASTYLLAPIGYLGRLSSTAFATLALLRDVLTAAGALTLHNEFALMNPVVHSVFYNLCGRISPITCYYLFQLLGGQTRELNYDVLDTWNALAPSARSSYEVLPNYNGVSPFVPVNSEGIYGPMIRRLEADLTGIP